MPRDCLLWSALETTWWVLQFDPAVFHCSKPTKLTRIAKGIMLSGENDCFPLQSAVQSCCVGWTDAAELNVFTQWKTHIKQGPLCIICGYLSMVKVFKWNGWPSALFLQICVCFCSPCKSFRAWMNRLFFRLVRCKSEQLFLPLKLQYPGGEDVFSCYRVPFRTFYSGIPLIIHSNHNSSSGETDRQELKKQTKNNWSMGDIVPATSPYIRKN